MNATIYFNVYTVLLVAYVTMDTRVWIGNSCTFNVTSFLWLFVYLSGLSVSASSSLSHSLVEIQH